MRVLTSLALLTSAVVAFNQLRQDSSVLSTHQQDLMDSGIRNDRILQQEASAASFYRPKRRLVANGLLSCFTGCAKGGSRPAPAAARQDPRYIPHRPEVQARLNRESQQRASRPATPARASQQINYPRDMRSNSQRRADMTKMHPLVGSGGSGGSSSRSRGRGRR